ncbi:MAG: hypothetical protein U9R05_04665, partial [Chloroflexota bacterium]|nr:hypothetical protein [Chloroflexota bacterium]
MAAQDLFNRKSRFSKILQHHSRISAPWRLCVKISSFFQRGLAQVTQDTDFAAGLPGSADPPPVLNDLNVERVVEFRRHALFQQ